MEIRFLRQSWPKGWRQLHKIKRNRFFYGILYSWFFAIFCQKTSKFYSWVNCWVLQGFESFGNLWGNSYIHFPVIIIYFRFTCGKVKLCWKVKTSLNVLSKIVGLRKMTHPAPRETLSNSWKLRLCERGIQKLKHAWNMMFFNIYIQVWPYKLYQTLWKYLSSPMIDTSNVIK